MWKEQKKRMQEWKKKGVQTHDTEADNIAQRTQKMKKTLMKVVELGKLLR